MIRYLPAVLAVVMSFVANAVIGMSQPIPERAVWAEIGMCGAALMTAAPWAWIWGTGLAILFVGSYITGFSIGMFYYPSIAAAIFVINRRTKACAGENRRPR